MLRRVLLVSCFASLFALAVKPANAQSTPADSIQANPADVESIGAIIEALYESISGPAGSPRDWDRFRSLFAPGARLMPVAEPPNRTPFTQVATPEEYITSATPYFDQNAFYEVELFRKEDRYGRIAQVFSTYESFNSPDATEPFMRGINSIQLMWDDERWWILSIFWNHENPSRPIPAQYLPADDQ